MSEKKKQHGAGQLLPLFVSFLKIGAFTFGGGYAMIPLIQKEAADRHKWMTDEEIMEIVAIAESILKDINDFAAFNAVYGEYFTTKPARSCVGGLSLPKGALVEVEVIAEV